MAKTITPLRYSRDDFPDQEWMDKFLPPLNNFASVASAALNGQLSISENTTSEVLTFKISANSQPSSTTPLKVKTGIDRVQGIAVLRVRDLSATPADLTVAPWVNWSQSKDQVVMTSILGLTATKAYEITLLLVAG